MENLLTLKRIQCNVTNNNTCFYIKVTDKINEKLIIEEK